jgi:oxygen-independent coproporphyrinogen-3 oxidase
MSQQISIDAEFLKKYDKPGPRYTSYPPAPYFTRDFNNSKWIQLLKGSNEGRGNISLYFHIPFCPRRCLYCGCTTESCADKGLIRSYHEALLREMDLVFDFLDKQRPVSQVHFGGGTPNFFPVKFLRALLERVKADFQFSPESEIAIECDPNLLSYGKLAGLRDMGFNRISLGLQDFNREVLNAVKRKFPSIHPRDLIKKSRDLGFSGINLDLIYGLPRQTPDTFKQTLERTVNADPDRIAVFGYAHVPWQMAHQKALENMGLPTPVQRIRMAVHAHNILVASGYVSIGMDHYSKPDDALAVALRNGMLHRNFQGYCTRETTGQVYAFGASGIYQLYKGYAQNYKQTRTYIQSITRREWPLERGYFMSGENIFFREVINSLMCRGKLVMKDLAEATAMTPSSVRKKLSPGLEQIEDFIEDGMVVRKGDDVEVTPKGWLVVRCIAMLFDPLLEQNKARFSRTV